MPFKNFHEFIKLESSGGIVLFVTAVLALIIDNTPWSPYYHTFFSLPMTIQLGMLTLSKPLLLWINDGFMTIFFLLVGLEIKREIFEGELNSLQKVSLPAFAAFGGMIVPALIYIYFNHDNAVSMQGWAIPTATDIAFSLGILALLGSRIPVSLKIFLTALAIFDDIGAIVIIAIFYTDKISIYMLLSAAGLIIVLTLLNRFRVMRFEPYFLVGLVLWLCVLKSGVHATLAGLVIAFAIPLKDPKHPTHSPLRTLEHKLHPWVAFGILPVFAFANAGMSFKGLTMQHFVHPVTIGIACGLFLGKQIGIWAASYFAIKTKIAKMPKNVTGMGIYGVAVLAGVGFTMSLFIGTLAFGKIGGIYPALVRMGVISASLLSGIFGYLILRWAYRKY